MANASLDCERVDRAAGRTLIVRGEIDVASVAAFRRQLSELLAEARSPGYVDLAGVTFMDSSAIAALIDADIGAAPDKSIVLVDPSPICDLVFEALGLQARFDIVRS